MNNGNLNFIIRHRFALAAIRERVLLSKTDIEVLAFAKDVEVFSVYQLMEFYSITNTQQLRSSVSRLHRLKFLELLKPGIRNRSAVYCISYAGEDILNDFLMNLS